MSDLSALTPGVWNVDHSHSAVSFSVRHLMVSKVRGRFEKFSAAIVVADDPLQSSVEAEVDLSSVNTNDEGRDNHLRTNDFFDVANYPTMTFKSTSIRPDGDDYILVGDLTIKGVTKSVEFELEFAGVEKDPWGGTRAGFSAEAEIDRSEFGVEFNAVLETGGVMVGNKVKVTLDVEAVKA